MIKIRMQGWHQPDVSHSLPSATGAVRWNGYTKKFEVDVSGVGWHEINNTVEAYPIYNANATDDGTKEKIYTWALKKIAEEEEEKALREKYPSLVDAYNYYVLVKELVKDHT